MSSQAARAYMTIGEVLGQLRGEFPDVTISKIRFLESEGLIEPGRSPSGYRQFSHADVDRLRFILVTQRDQYLPLRVIKEYLDAVDSGADPQPPHRASRAARRLVATDGSEAADEGGADVRLTRRQLLDASGASGETLTELEEYGLVRRTGSHYDGQALEILRTAAALAGFGFQARHLRAVKAAAEREVGMIEQAVAPMQRQRGPGAAARADEVAREITQLSLKLHSALVSAGLQESFNR